MLRSIVGSAIRATSLRTSTNFVTIQRACFASLNHNNNTASSLLPRSTFGKLIVPASSSNLLQSVGAAPLQQQQAVRSVTKFSLLKGKRKTVKAVLKRFKRLDWGAWIRTYTGRQKKLFKKSPGHRRRLRQHVFTNASQSWLLDKMVTNYWRKPKHYIDDPYAPYHKRDEFFATKGKTFKV